MITVSRLREMCERVEKEFGEFECPVRIMIRDKEGRLIEMDDCRHVFLKIHGELILSNHKPESK